MAITRLFNRWGMERAALKWAYRAARFREDWAEPWVAMGALHFFLDQREAALEALIGANARDPSSRVIMLMIAQTLDSIEMCESAYEWHCQAAHAIWNNPRAASDGHADAMFWCELGIYCLGHDRYDEAQVVATYATLYRGRGG